MQAIRVHEFGGREQLHIETVDRPEPTAEEALVRVTAAGVNPYDWMTREGEGADVTVPWIPGWDFSGTVETVGADVTHIAAGDDVFGMLADERGAYAEYVSVPATDLVPKPRAVSHTTAAAVPMAGLTAWQALFDAAEFQPGQRVLVHAAAGGVGHIAVQLANWVGATTVGTASASNRAYLEGLGLDEFVNYREQNVEDIVAPCDVVLDLVGGDTLERSVDLLRPGGFIAKLPAPLTDAEQTLLDEANVRGVYPVVQWRPDQFRAISTLLETGALDVRIDSVFPLEEVASAHERSESGHARGKIVLDVGPDHSAEPSQEMAAERVSLDGEYVRLEPLSMDRHLSGLQEAGADASLFEWFAADYSTPEGMRTFVSEALAAESRGDALPFATIWQATDEVIGSTRFCAIRPETRSVEIGWTWITPEYQRTPANTEAKFLLLRHAFEEWECVRVEFETAAGNERAREALSRIGATEEGVLRKHMLIHGEPQDSVYFSIIDSEWPDVEEMLSDQLDRQFP